MKIIRHIKFLLKKLIMSKNEYDILMYKASVVDKLSKCINVNVESDYEYARSGRGAKLLCFEKSRDYVVTVDVPKIIEAVNIKFELPYKLNIISE